MAQYVSVQAIEPHFYKALVRGMGLEKAGLPKQNDKRHWCVKDHVSKLAS